MGIGQIIRKAVCKVRGHRYSTNEFNFAYSLYFCSCCGREIFDRTFDDIEPMPDEELEMLHRMGGY